MRLGEVLDVDEVPARVEPAEAEHRALARLEDDPRDHRARRLPGAECCHTLATRLPELAAAVPFYGNHPPASEAVKVKAPRLIHFADQDERINAAWPAYEAALKAAGARFEAQRHPGTQHGFHNDTTPRYDAGAARLAWSRTLDFLARQLKS